MKVFVTETGIEFTLSPDAIDGFKCGLYIEDLDGYDEVTIGQLTIGLVDGVVDYWDTCGDNPTNVLRNI